MIATRAAIAVAAAFALAACGGSKEPPVTGPTPGRTAGTGGGTVATNRSTAVVLGVPPGHLPPPGQCRVWIPGRPPGKQARARSCAGIIAVAPAGSMIIYRPTRDKKVVRVRYVDSRRAGVVIRVRLFEANTGKFLQDEQDEPEKHDEKERGKRKP